LYGTPLPFQTSLKYLNLLFMTTGIDQHGHLDQLVKKGFAAAALLYAIGVKGHGFPLLTFIKLYTAFIRPALEYVPGLICPTKNLATRLDKAQ
ncbi:hypothetical protein BDK51DRAFT_12447, partial [Blyttiomyces helicus]